MDQVPRFGECGCPGIGTLSGPPGASKTTGMEYTPERSELLRGEGFGSYRGRTIDFGQRFLDILLVPVLTSERVHERFPARSECGPNHSPKSDLISSDVESMRGAEVGDDDG